MKAMYCTQTYETNGRPVTNPVLINSMRAGVEQAWSHLYAVYWNWLVQLALGMGVSRQDAEDLAQKTFIALRTGKSSWSASSGVNRKRLEESGANDSVV